MTYQLPHPLDRPGQQEAMTWILESDKKYLILSAPTGFGKSPLAAAASLDHRTLALVLHKSLQSANYREQYNFDILYGKGNYPCIEKNREGKQQTFLPAQYFSAFDCSNPHCDCPYQKQELKCLSSNRVSLNYAKFLMSKAFTESFQPDILFLDEAHNLPNIVMNYVGLSIDWNNEFLYCIGGLKPPDENLMRLNRDEAMALFRQCARMVQQNKPDREKDLPRWRKWKRLNQKINITNQIIATGNLKDWYYEATDKSLIMKPLTAKYHFKRMFGIADKIILMSATITPRIAERLGLEKDEYDFHQVANPWPVPSRLIYDLGGPAINHKSSGKDKDEQARLIAGVLHPDKTGTIHVSSKFQANELSVRLYRTSKGLTFFVSKVGMSTDKQYNEWLRIRKPGTYHISWNFHEGIDLGEDDIGILAKIPYVSLSSDYEKVRMKHDQQWYLLQAAMKTEQTCGRLRRGKEEHYNGSKMIFIADSSYSSHQLKGLLSDDFRRAIRRWNGKA